jgi:integrase
MAVPLALAGRFKRRWIIEGLGTDSEREARDRAAKRKAHWQTVFERAAQDAPLTLAEVDEAAQEVYTDTLARMDRDWKVLGTFLGCSEQEWLEISLRRAGDPPAHEIKRIERAKGLSLDPASAIYATLARALTRAITAALEGRLRLLEGQPSEMPRSFLGAEGINPLTLKPIGRRPKIVRGDGGLRFSEAAALHLEEVGPTMRKQTIVNRNGIYAKFVEFVRDQTISAITRADAADFLTSLTKDRSARTVNNYQMVLGQVFKWARKRGRLDGANPFEDQTFKQPPAVGWLEFSKDELEKLLEKSPEALLWPMRIALYSGMRLNEVAGLRKEDVRQEHGVWFFDVVEHEARKLKTNAARRRVPVHSKLIEMGVLQYDFPTLPGSGADKKPGKLLGEKFGKYKKRLGVTRAQTSFHSFRKNFATSLDRAAVHIDDAAALLGHRRSFSWSVYSSGPGLKRLQEIVEKVTY